MKITIGHKHLGKPGVYRDPNNGYTAMNRKKFTPINPALPKNKVAVRITREATIEVEIWARHGNGDRSVIGTIQPRESRNAEELIQKVMVTAGACAEHLCEAFGNDLDPDLCALYAEELFKEAARRAGEQFGDAMKVPTIITP